MDEHATALYEAVVAAVPGWIERSIEQVIVATGATPDGDVMAAARRAGKRAQAEVGAELQVLLGTDLDEQSSTPLSVVRGAVRHATTVLEAVGVPSVRRDETRRRLFPRDTYDLSPASLGEVDPGLTSVALIWGAAKAHAHIQRRRGQ